MDGLTLLLLGGAAGAAGFVDAVAGGGGMLVMPALLATGMPPHQVLGTAKLAGTCGTTVASLAFIRKGLVSPRLWGAMALATGLGALFGAVLAHLTSRGLLERLLPLAIILAALWLVWPRRRPPPALIPPPLPGTGQQWLAGGSIGFYDGLIGPGTGAFWTAVALRGFRLELVRAAGVARLMNFVSNISALATFMVLGHVNYSVGLVMGAALMVGAWLGAHSAMRFGAPFIRPVFIGVVLVMAGRQAWVAFG